MSHQAPHFAVDSAQEVGAGTSQYIRQPEKWLLLACMGDPERGTDLVFGQQ